MPVKAYVWSGGTAPHILNLGVRRKCELHTPAALLVVPETIRTYCCKDISSAHPGNRTTIPRSSSPQSFHYAGLIWTGTVLGNIGSVRAWFWKKHLL
jgi:hypothetical protein